MQLLRSTQMFVVALFLLSTARTPAAEINSQSPNALDTQVTALVRDGRVLQGQVDDRTDDEVLWLRITRGAVVLSTGLSWDLIQEVQLESNRHTAAEFRTMAKSYASASPKLSTTHTANKPSVPSAFTARQTNAATLVRVHSLHLEAEIANWDRDAESDGIAIRVLPLGIDRRVLAIDGVVSVELFGREFSSGRENQGFPLLGQWSQRVRSTDFRASEGAVYYLPTNRQLDHEPSLLSVGMVRATLTVNGQGHFDAVASTRLRTYNPIRDQIDEYRTRHDAFGRYRGRHW